MNACRQTAAPPGKRPTQPERRCAPITGSRWAADLTRLWTPADVEDDARRSQPPPASGRAPVHSRLEIAHPHHPHPAIPTAPQPRRLAVHSLEEKEASDPQDDHFS